MTLNKLLAGIALTATLGLTGCYADLVYQNESNGRNIRVLHDSFFNEDWMIVKEGLVTTKYVDFGSNGSVDKVVIYEKKDEGSNPTIMTITSSSAFGEENLAKYTKTYRILLDELSGDVTIKQKALVGPN